MVWEDGCFILLHEMMIIFSQLTVELHILGRECLYSVIELIFLEFIIFDDRFFKLFLKILDFELIRITICFIELSKMCLE